MDLLLVLIVVPLLVFFFWTGYDTYQQAKKKGRNAWGWFGLWLIVGLVLIGWAALIPWAAIRLVGPAPATATA